MSQELVEVVIDFETYFDKNYTLSKLPISAYVRDERFHVFGAGVRVGNGEPFFLTEENLRQWITSWDWSKTIAIGHHMHFDGFILSDHYGVYPAYFGDTLSMARPSFGPACRVSLDSIAQIIGCPPKDADILNMMGIRDPSTENWDLLARRAMGDIDRTRKCYDFFLAHGFPQMERNAIDVTIKMFTDPAFILDVKAVYEIQEEEEKQRKELYAAVNMTETQLRSDIMFAEVLKRRGVLIPEKYSEAQKSMVPAFASNDPDFMAWKADPNLAPYYYARTAAKSTATSSKTERLLAAGAPPYKLPVYLNYCGAHTLRHSGGDKLNFQNFKRKHPIRRTLTAPDGQLIAVVDASQIEARIIAWLSNQDDLLAQFADPNQDPYRSMAAKLYGGKPFDYDAESVERYIGKTLVLGAGYGMGSVKLRGQLLQNKQLPLNYSLEECQKMIDVWRNANSKIVDFWGFCNGRLFDMAKGPKENEDLTYKCITFVKRGVLMPNGLVMRFPSLEKGKDNNYWYSTIRGPKKIYGGALTENIVQCLAGILLREHMVEIAKHFKVTLTVHDEIVAFIPEKGAEEAFALITEIATQSPQWAPDLPVACEGQYDKVYSK